MPDRVDRSIRALELFQRTLRRFARRHCVGSTLYTLFGAGLERALRRVVQRVLERRRSEVEREDFHVFEGVQTQSRTSGMSSPCSRMYASCSTRRSRISCLT